MSATNVLATIMILPVSNEKEIGRSILPDRFASGTKEQTNPILGGGLGLTSVPLHASSAFINPILIDS